MASSELGGLGQEMLTELLDQIPAGLVVAEAEAGRIVFYNAAAERIWGRPLRRDEAIWSYRVGDIAYLDGRPYQASELPLARALRGEVVRAEELKIRRTDGAWAVLVCYAAPVRNGEQKIIGGVVTYTDLTQRREAEEALRRAQERLQSLIDNIDGIVWELDVATFRFTFVSQQAERLLGYPIEDWYEPDFWLNILHHEDREWALSFCLESTKRMQPHEFEYRVVARDGHIVWLRDLVRVVVSEGRPVALRGVMVDSTARKQAEADRERLYEEARNAVNLRDEFLSVASHELYTPLTSLRIAVQAMTTGAIPLTGESLTRSLQLVERQTNRLVNLVRQLLDVSRLHAGRLELDLEEVDLAGVVEEIVGQFGNELTRARSTVDLHVSSEHLVGRWDRLRLEQVVCNLLSNALKFGAGKPIEIELDATNERATLLVRDHGIGIAPEQLAHIFERFERGVSARRYGGLGLGLYIVRGIVQSLGGSIHAESALGVGSSFFVELPRAMVSPMSPG